MPLSLLERFEITQHLLTLIIRSIIERPLDWYRQQHQDIVGANGEIDTSKITDPPTKTVCEHLMRLTHDSNYRRLPPAALLEKWNTLFRELTSTTNDTHLTKSSAANIWTHVEAADRALYAAMRALTGLTDATRHHYNDVVEAISSQSNFDAFTQLDRDGKTQIARSVSAMRQLVEVDRESQQSRSKPTSSSSVSASDSASSSSSSSASATLTPDQVDQQQLVEYILALFPDMVAQAARDYNNRFQSAGGPQRYTAMAVFNAVKVMQLLCGEHPIHVFEDWSTGERSGQLDSWCYAGNGDAGSDGLNTEKRAKIRTHLGRAKDKVAVWQEAEKTARRSESGPAASSSSSSSLAIQPYVGLHSQPTPATTAVMHHQRQIMEHLRNFQLTPEQRQAIGAAAQGTEGPGSVVNFFFLLPQQSAQTPAESSPLLALHDVPRVKSYAHRYNCAVNWLLLDFVRRFGSEKVEFLTPLRAIEQTYRANLASRLGIQAGQQVQADIVDRYFHAYQAIVEQRLNPLFAELKEMIKARNQIIRAFVASEKKKEKDVTQYETILDEKHQEENSMEYDYYTKEESLRTYLIGQIKTRIGALFGGDTHLKKLKKLNGDIVAKMAEYNKFISAQTLLTDVAMAAAILFADDNYDAVTVLTNALDEIHKQLIKVSRREEKGLFGRRKTVDTGLTRVLDRPSPAAAAAGGSSESSTKLEDLLEKEKSRRQGVTGSNAAEEAKVVTLGNEAVQLFDQVIKEARQEAAEKDLRNLWQRAQAKHLEFGKCLQYLQSEELPEAITKLLGELEQKSEQVAKHVQDYKKQQAVAGNKKCSDELIPALNDALKGALQAAQASVDNVNKDGDKPVIDLTGVATCLSALKAKQKEITETYGGAVDSTPLTAGQNLHRALQKLQENLSILWDARQALKTLQTNNATVQSGESAREALLAAFEAAQKAFGEIERLSKANNLGLVDVAADAEEEGRKEEKAAAARDTKLLHERLFTDVLTEEISGVESLQDLATQIGELKTALGTQLGTLSVACKNACTAFREDVTRAKETSDQAEKAAVEVFDQLSGELATRFIALNQTRSQIIQLLAAVTISDLGKGLNTLYANYKSSFPSSVPASESPSSSSSASASGEKKEEAAAAGPETVEAMVQRLKKQLEGITDEKERCSSVLKTREEQLRHATREFTEVAYFNESTWARVSYELISPTSSSDSSSSAAPVPTHEVYITARDKAAKLTKQFENANKTWAVAQALKKAFASNYTDTDLDSMYLADDDNLHHPKSSEARPSIYTTVAEAKASAELIIERANTAKSQAETQLDQAIGIINTTLDEADRAFDEIDKFEEIDKSLPLFQRIAEMERRVALYDQAGKSAGVESNTILRSPDPEIQDKTKDVKGKLEAVKGRFTDGVKEARTAASKQLATLKGERTNQKEEALDQLRRLTETLGPSTRLPFEHNARMGVYQDIREQLQKAQTAVLNLQDPELVTQWLSAIIVLCKHVDTMFESSGSVSFEAIVMRFEWIDTVYQMVQVAKEAANGLDVSGMTTEGLAVDLVSKKAEVMTAFAATEQNHAAMKKARDDSCKTKAGTLKQRLGGYVPPSQPAKILAVQEAMKGLDVAIAANPANLGQLKAALQAFLTAVDRDAGVFNNQPLNHLVDSRKLSAAKYSSSAKKSPDPGTIGGIKLENITIVDQALKLCQVARYAADRLVGDLAHVASRVAEYTTAHQATATNLRSATLLVKKGGVVQQIEALIHLSKIFPREMFETKLITEMIPPEKLTKIGYSAEAKEAKEGEEEKPPQTLANVVALLAATKSRYDFGTTAEDNIGKDIAQLSQFAAIIDYAAHNMLDLLKQLYDLAPPNWSVDDIDCAQEVIDYFGSPEGAKVCRAYRDTDASTSLTADNPLGLNTVAARTPLSPSSSSSSSSSSASPSQTRQNQISALSPRKPGGSPFRGRGGAAWTPTFLGRGRGRGDGFQTPPPSPGAGGVTPGTPKTPQNVTSSLSRGGRGK